MKLKYIVPDYEQELEDAYEVEVKDYEESWLEFAAAHVAEDFENNHDGWEAGWPVEFDIYKEDNTLLGRFRVEREYSPYFLAKKIK